MRTWLFRIVVNRAISTGIRERVHLPVDDSELEADDGRFSQDGWWVTPPAHWADEAVDRLTAPELAERVRRAIEQLPPQTTSGGNAARRGGTLEREVCEVLGITEGNQRVLLHRGRARVRAELEREMLS